MTAKVLRNEFKELKLSAMLPSEGESFFPKEVFHGSYDRQAPKQREPGYDRKCRDAVKEDRKIEIDAGRRNPRTVESSAALALRFSYHDSAVRSSVSCQYGSHAVGGIHFPVNNEVPADDPGCELFAN